MVILVKEYTLVSLGSAISPRSTDSGFIAEDSKCLARNSVCWPNFVFRHSPWFPLAVGAGVFGETSFESRVPSSSSKLPLFSPEYTESDSEDSHSMHSLDHRDSLKFGVFVNAKESAPKRQPEEAQGSNDLVKPIHDLLKSLNFDKAFSSSSSSKPSKLPKKNFSPPQRSFLTLIKENQSVNLKKSKSKGISTFPLPSSEKGILGPKPSLSPSSSKSFKVDIKGKEKDLDSQNPSSSSNQYVPFSSNTYHQNDDLPISSSSILNLQIPIPEDQNPSDPILPNPTQPEPSSIISFHTS
ncbi:hypothetical protein L6452_39239 [Arctium lappa]|uniref:Uncharacterized protein n=1 Tax=Arctium lappa TaxID=4217 RepID=A0ACB8XRY8_ARCLA|nr:hypothetical protein L6452_39239 [Arctium lappa]